MADSCYLPSDEDKLIMSQTIQLTPSESETIEQFVDEFVLALKRENEIENAKNAVDVFNKDERKQVRASRSNPYARPRTKLIRGGGKLKYIQYTSKIISLIIYLGATYGIYTGISFVLGLIVTKLSEHYQITSPTMMKEVVDSCISMFNPSNIVEEEENPGLFGNVKNLLMPEHEESGFSFQTVKNVFGSSSAAAKKLFMDSYDALIKLRQKIIITESELADQDRQMFQCVSARTVEHFNELVTIVVTMLSAITTSGLAFTGWLTAIIREPYVRMEEIIFYRLSDMTDDMTVATSIYDGDLNEQRVKTFFTRRPNVRRLFKDILFRNKLGVEPGVFVREGHGPDVRDYRRIGPPGSYDPVAHQASIDFWGQNQTEEGAEREEGGIFSYEGGRKKKTTKKTSKKTQRRRKTKYNKRSK
jgi:hypothetical protein